MFVLIGGGDLKTKSTKAIDEFIINKSNKTNPRVLFIPTASNDSKKSIDNFLCSYEGLASIDVLRLYDGIKMDNAYKMIDEADIIYVGGGNTFKMIEKWNEYNLTNYILKYSNDKIICGMSAGAICWFEYFLSDCDAYYDDMCYYNFKVKKGIGFLKGICCPHYNEDGREVFNDIVRDMNIIGYAIENNCALVIDGNNEYVIKSIKSSSCYKFLKDEFIMKEVK